MKFTKITFERNPKLGDLMELIDTDREISWGILAEGEEGELFLVLLNISTLEFIVHIQNNEIITKTDTFTILNIYSDIVIKV